jgi:quercetin dioxygenase-like cupin family protein
MDFLSNYVRSLFEQVWSAIMDEPNDSRPQARLRSHPSGRFAGESHVFNLGEVLATLRAEAHPAEHGHRQMTIFHRAPVTQVVFAFEPGGELADHAAHGLVTIHVLEGRLAVQADARDHELRAGDLLVLNPDVRHRVRALDASAMLLTVHLERE